MKNPKPLVLALTLFTFSFYLLTNVSCKKDDPCAEKTWYKDTDMDDEGDAANTIEACEQPNGYVANSNDPDDTNDQITSDCEQLTYYADEDEDGYGNPNSSITQCSGVDTPIGYVEDNTDCADDDPTSYPGQTYYEDSDMDGFGNPESFQMSCLKPEGYTLDATDCNDNDDTIYPGADDNPYDGTDSDCDGTPETPPSIWNGPHVDFILNADEDWTLQTNQDKLTDKVSFTRINEDNCYLYNYQWWQDKLGQDAVHNDHLQDGNGCDHIANFYGLLDSKVNPNLQLEDLVGGTQGVRWSIEDPGEGNYPNQAWENFELYGELGNPNNFFSFHNVITILSHFDNNTTTVDIVDDYTVELESGNTSTAAVSTKLENKSLYAWLIEDNIYLKITFTHWGDVNDPGQGGVSYTRSSPNNP